MKLLLILVLLCSTSFISQASDKIIWYAFHNPPAFILSGPDKGKGYIDLVQQLVIDSLPQYQHENREVTIKRLIQDMKAGLPVCFAAITKTQDRKHYISFSSESLVSPNLQIIIKKQKADRLKLENKIDLEDMFTLHQLTMSKQIARAHGQLIDGILQRHAQYINDRVNDSAFSHFKMLEKDRVDFLIALPSVANYTLSQLKNPSQYRTIKIKGVEQFRVGYIGCSKNAWGEAVISDINLALKKIKTTNEYLQALTMWLTPEDLNHEFYRYFLNEFVRN